MRLSVIESDPGYSKNAGHYEVLLNGIVLGHALTADEEKRAVLCYVLDEHGKPVRNKDRPTQVMTQVRRGEVHICKRRPRSFVRTAL